MKLFAWTLLASSATAFDLEIWDEQNEDAFAWLEPKSRLRREGDADDQKVLLFEKKKEDNDIVLETKKFGNSNPVKFKPIAQTTVNRGKKRNKKKKANWKAKTPSQKRQKIRAARRRRKQLRRQEQERRKEWRQLHRNKETGDYDDYGPYQSAATKESKKKEQRRNRRKNRGKNRGKLDKTDKGKNKAQIALTTVQTTMLSTIKTTEKQQQTTSIFILPMVTTTQRPTTQRPTTLAMITTKKSVNRERVYNLKSFFENETFDNATKNHLEFNQFQVAKMEATQWDDNLSQNTLEKYELLKYMMLYLQPEEFQDWNKFSNYGCWCFQSQDTEFWKGQGLPKDDIDKTCRKLSMCYHCIANDYPQAICSAETKYNFIGLEDGVTDDRYIQCVDQEGTCERHICECDKKFAEDLRSQSETSSISLHQEFGFDREGECKQQIGTPPWDECCGKYPNRMPYASKSSRSCCENQTYETIFNKCCDDRIVSKSATCSA